MNRGLPGGLTLHIDASAQQPANTQWLVLRQRQPVPCRLSARAHGTERSSSTKGHAVASRPSTSASNIRSNFPAGTAPEKNGLVDIAPKQIIEESTLINRLSQKLKQLFSSPYDATILNLALPSILALAADPLLAMVRLNTPCWLQTTSTAFDALLAAALGVNNSLFSFAFVVFNFLAVATTPTVAAALSAKDKQKAGTTILQALFLATALGTLVTAGLISNSELALQLMGMDPADKQLLELASQFLIIRATAAPAALLVTVSQGVYRGLMDMRTPLGITIATNVVHLLLSILFIFNMHMGLSGAALSTTVSEWLAATAYLGLGWQRREELGLWPLPCIHMQDMGSQYLPFLKAGGAVLMRTSVLLGTKTLASAVATRLGPAAIASHQVLSQTWVLSSLVVDSLAIAGQTMVAVKLGQDDKAAARQVTDRLLQLGLGLGLTLSGLLFACSPLWPHLFTQDKDVVQTVSELLPLTICMLPINSLVYVLDGVLVGASDFQFLVGAMMMASGGAAATLLAVEPLDLGLRGVWLALAALMAGRLVTLMWRYQSPAGPLPSSSSRSSSSTISNVVSNNSRQVSSSSSSSSSMALSNGAAPAAHAGSMASNSPLVHLTTHSIGPQLSSQDEIMQDINLQEVDATAEYLGHAAARRALAAEQLPSEGSTTNAAERAANANGRHAQQGVHAMSANALDMPLMDSLSLSEFTSDSASDATAHHSCHGPAADDASVPEEYLVGASHPPAGTLSVMQSMRVAVPHDRAVELRQEVANAACRSVDSCDDASPAAVRRGHS